jgi:acyl-[acyl-carrier-protein]-phospholipid O-acyltransferase/long-chain-fatty-acid--[acyl-carrier-protein] ligase
MGALLRARLWYGGKRVCIIDADGRRLTYDDLVRAAFALGHALKKDTASGEAVAILLPTGAGSAISFFAISAYGRVPAMLNFTAGAKAIAAACAAVRARRIVTARKFVELGGFHALVAKLGQDHEIIYLEDVRDALTKADKIAAVVGSLAPWLLRARPSPDSPGVYLFTSGTEGDPKGVALTHANLVANAEQLRQHIPELYPTDMLVMPLPTFHCFGLTAGLLLPLLAGFPTALHPTPLQARTIVERVRDLKATLVFATDTFMGQYLRVAEGDDLKTLRFAVCGAERVKDETRLLMRRRFGVEVLEGYGVTEAAPVIAVNQVTFNKLGTVGRLLPGMEARLEPVPGIPEGGRLFVRGPNVMRGYVGKEGPEEVTPLESGWHDTGDIVSFDEEGCITIRGRVKRFAKIGGEMVSLSVVENCATSLWPDNGHAAIALPQGRKGEEIVLVTDNAEASRGDFVAFTRSHGISELAVPRRILVVDAVPILGTGKIDYVAVQRLAMEQLQGMAEAAT